MPTQFDATVKINAATFSPDKCLYKKEFTEEKELEKFIDAYGTSIKGWGILKGSIFVEKMDTLGNFASDFFLPTLMNSKVKVYSASIKTFVQIGEFFWDLLTLPARAFTFPLRVLHYLCTDRKNDYPLHPLIRDGLIPSDYRDRYKANFLFLSITSNKSKEAIGKVASLARGATTTRKKQEVTLLTKTVKLNPLVQFPSQKVKDWTSKTVLTTETVEHEFPRHKFAQKLGKVVKVNLPDYHSIESKESRSDYLEEDSVVVKDVHSEGQWVKTAL